MGYFAPDRMEGETVLDAARRYINVPTAKNRTGNFQGFARYGTAACAAYLVPVMLAPLLPAWQLWPFAAVLGFVGGWWADRQAQFVQDPDLDPWDPDTPATARWRPLVAATIIAVFVGGLIGWSGYRGAGDLSISERQQLEVIESGSGELPEVPASTVPAVPVPSPGDTSNEVSPGTTDPSTDLPIDVDDIRPIPPDMVTAAVTAVDNWTRGLPLGLYGPGLVVPTFPDYPAPVALLATVAAAPAVWDVTVTLSDAPVECAGLCPQARVTLVESGEGGWQIVEFTDLGVVNIAG